MRRCIGLLLVATLVVACDAWQQLVSVHRIAAHRRLWKHTVVGSATSATKSYARAALTRLCAAEVHREEEEEEEEEEGEIQEATLYKRKKGAFKPLQPKDNRDALLYRVTEITPPPRQLGNFKLGPSAACGDLISARVRMDDSSPKEEQTFVIKKVSYVYEFQRGAYRMVGKRAGVKAASRDAVEAVLNRMLPDEAGASDTPRREREGEEAADDGSA